MPEPDSELSYTPETQYFYYLFGTDSAGEEVWTTQWNDGGTEDDPLTIPEGVYTLNLEIGADPDRARPEGWNVKFTKPLPDNYGPLMYQSTESTHELRIEFKGEDYGPDDSYPYEFDKSADAQNPIILLSNAALRRGKTEILIIGKIKLIGLHVGGDDEIGKSLGETATVNLRYFFDVERPKK